MALKKYELERMCSSEIDEAIKQSKGIVVIIAGATEQHGPHGTLDTDTACTIEAVRRAAEKEYVVVAPPIPIGNSCQNFSPRIKGTLWLRSRTLENVIIDMGTSLIKNGFDKIIIANGHGGNIPPCSNAAEELKYNNDGVFVACVKVWELHEGEDIEFPELVDYCGHGCLETGYILHLRPEDVRKDRYCDSKPEVKLTEFGCVWPPQFDPYKSPIQVILSVEECVPYGHFGDPTPVTAELGDAVMEAQAKNLAKFFTALKNGQVTWRKVK
jgi:creatinine amidohydrolase